MTLGKTRRESKLPWLDSSFAIPKNGPRAARLVKFTPAD
jgi:hypothetical protein